MAPAPLIDGLLLGGGHGRRAGGPKALRLWDGEPAWRWQAGRMRRWGCRAVTAVLHPDAWLESEPVPPEGGGVTMVRADPDAPMFASLQRGLRALADREDGPPAWILLLPVDCPWPGDDVADALRDAAAQAHRRVGVVRPRAGERHGHPLLLRREASAELTWMDARFARLDRWIDTMGPHRVLGVPVPGGSVLTNLNR